MTPRVVTQMPESLLDPVREAFGDAVEIVFLPPDAEVPDDLRAEIVLTLPWGTPNLPELLTKGVEWVHAYGTGVNGFPFEVLRGVPLTCSRGASARMISEWVIAVMLAAEKQLPERWIEVPPDRWNVAEIGSLAGRRLALVGFGGIGEAVARRALPFEMQIRALRRTASSSPLPEVEIVTRLDALLADADHVVIAAPYTKATHHLFSDAAFEAMKPGAHLVNVARGGLVDQDALRRALDAGRVGLASLDCVDPEPLPAGHWLYDHPRTRVSAHISWCGEGAHSGLIDRFVENLGRHLRGESLAYRVDPEEGY